MHHFHVFTCNSLLIHVKLGPQVSRAILTDFAKECFKKFSLCYLKTWFIYSCLHQTIIIHWKSCHIQLRETNYCWWHAMSLLAVFIHLPSRFREKKNVHSLISFSLDLKKEPRRRHEPCQRVLSYTYLLTSSGFLLHHILTLKHYETNPLQLHVSFLLDLGA